MGLLELPEYSCSLCASSQTIGYAVARGRTYYRCLNCDLVCLSPSDQLSFEAEKKRYELHQNYSSDLGYRQHLSKALDPLILHLERGQRGVDFGCGPAPVVSIVMYERGYSVVNFDPFFFPDRSLLEVQYDFVVCTETVEHFRWPSIEFEVIDSMLRTGGHFSVMTNIRTDSQQFDKWWYVRDATHIAFYSEKTFAWIAKKWSWEVIESNHHVYLFKKR